jgi:hypothetical protein
MVPGRGKATFWKLYGTSWKCLSLATKDCNPGLHLLGSGVPTSVNNLLLVSKLRMYQFPRLSMPQGLFGRLIAL